MIVKYCHNEHNCLKGSKLLIGNLEKYRSIENEALRDKGEGTFNFDIEFLEGVKVSSAWANLIFGGAIGFGDSPGIRFPGSFNSNIKDCNIEYVSGDTVSFRHASASISYKVLNSFIFCTSMAEDDPMGSCPFPEYDDCWKVGVDKRSLDQFSARVGNLLLQQLTPSNFTGKLDNFSLSELKRISINIQHGPVKYINRSLKITADMANKFDEIMGTYLNVEFTKPAEPFQKEKEYRFVFKTIVDDFLIEASPQDVFLDLNSLSSKQ